jgi:Phospholipase_D-nuclease N-terminal
VALFFLLGFIAIIAMPSVLWLYALTDVIINEFRSLMTKFIWALFLCFFPPLGTLLYYLIGRSQRITCYPVGRVVFVCILLVPVVMIIAYLLYSLGHFTMFMEPPPKTIQI